MRHHAWTPKEHATLAAFYPAISAKRLQELLPDRTPKAIRQEASERGIRKCAERIKEQGAENVNRRWHPDDGNVFKTPSAPPQ